MKNVYRILSSIVMIAWVLVTPISAATYEPTDQLNWKVNTSTNQDEITDSDQEKPTLSAAINDGVLKIQGTDVGSGIAAIYVNSYEYSSPVNGVLNIHLQQFDAGYQYFTLQAKDLAGNASDIYKLKNPYYIDQALEKDKKDAAVELMESLPMSAVATNPSDAKGTVTGHTQMVPIQTIESNTGEPVVKEVETEVVETIEGAGKEFYTIQTKSDKVFYLIIDKSQKENNVYFLTEVSENDLLNFSESESEALPQNSAVVEAAVPISNNVIVKEETPGLNNEAIDGNETIAVSQDVTEATINQTEEKHVQPSNTSNYVMIGIVVLVVGGIGVYTKIVKGKKNQFEDEELEEDEEIDNEELIDEMQEDEEEIES